jgi:hypothetical protein
VSARRVTTAARRGIGLAARAGALATILVLAAGGGGARAALSVQYEPGVDGCTQAGSFSAEDQSEEAQRARLRCRNEQFARQLEDERQRQEAQRDQNSEQNLEAWMTKQDIPVRVMHRNAIDLYAGGGLTSYGITGSWLLLPPLEAEVWFGRRNVSEPISTGYLQDSRSCIGGRFKWLVRDHGNLTPLASAGLAECWANVAYDPYNFFVTGPTFLSNGQPAPSSAAGTAAAHVVTATAGLTWMDKSGLRASVEYLFAYAFYTQGTLNDAARTQDSNLRGAWEQRLTSDRSGVRLQVGYAF